MLIRRLLVPVDLSPRSAHALAYACELAAASGGAEVDVLHVIPGPGQLRSAVDGYLGRPRRACSSTVVTRRRSSCAPRRRPPRI